MTTYGPWFTISGSYQAQVGVNFRQVPDNSSITALTTSVEVYADEYLNINYSSNTNLHVASGNDFPSSGDIGVNLSHGERLLRTTSRTVYLSPGSGGSSTWSGTVSGLYGNAGVVVSSGAISWATAARPYGNGSVELSSTSFTMGVPVTVTAHRTNTTDQIQVYWMLPGADTSVLSNRQEYLTNGGTAGKVTTETVTWNTATDTVLAGLLASSTVMSGTLYCDYWDVSGNYLGTSSVGFTDTVSPSSIPTTGAVSAVETATSVISLGVGKYVQAVSIPRMTIASQAGIYSSPIVSGSFTVNGAQYVIAAVSGTVPAFTLPAPLSVSGNLTVSAYVTDARGHSSVPVTTSLSTLPYSLPSITAFDPTTRWDVANGIPDPLGTSIKVFSSGSASTLTNGSQFNTLSWNIKTQSASGGAITAYTPAQGITVTPPTLQWDHSSGDILGGGGLLASSSYYVTVTATDALGNSAQSTTLLTAGVVTMSWSRTGVGVGKIWQQGALDVNGEIYVNGKSLTTPTYLTVDLNTLTVSGNYYQSGNVNATLANNYPIAYAGLLEVTNYDGTLNFINQRYTTYKYDGANGSRVFNRNWYGNSWGLWRESAPVLGAWTVYTPTLSGMTIGNGWVAVHWEQIGKTVHLYAQIVFGTTTSISGTGVNFPLPVPAVGAPQGHVMFLDAGVNMFQGFGYASGSAMNIGYFLNGQGANITSTLPFTWTPGSTIYTSLAYEAA